jgi:hypothetical protein
MRRLSQISNKVEEVIVQDNVTPLRSVENEDVV